MALKEVAVQGMTIGITGAGISGSVTVLGTPSTKVKAEANGVYKDNLSVTIPTGLRDTPGLCTSVAPFPTNVPASAVKNRVDGVEPLRVDDETGTLNVPGVLDGGGACVISTTVKITDAGQTKVRAE